MTRYALIENHSGFVWWVGDAPDALTACSTADLECGNVPDSQYEPAEATFINQTGYLVYEAPAGFDVDDGQNEDEIARVSALPLVGRFSKVAGE